MDHAQAMEFISSVSWLGSKPGLDRVAELTRRLGSPQDSLRFVHVAGTNGKGSTSAMLAAVLTAAGYRTGLYTSPHLRSVSERYNIDGVLASDAEFDAVVSDAADAGRGMDDPCTEFELLTAAAFLYFARKKCDIVVLETGLGGRLDATNIIRCPECAVITNIGLDHTAVLGGTIGLIAAEKAGIFKGGRAVSYAQEPEAAAALEKAAEKTGTALRFADFSRIEPVSDGPDGQVFRFGGNEYRFGLLGEHQLKNAAVALTAVEALRSGGWEIPDRAVRGGLLRVRWPARFEIVSRSPWFVVDGGHNPQCVASTRRALEHYFPDTRRVLLIGVMADKDWRAMLDILAPASDAFVAVTPDNPRALPAPELAAAIREYGKPAAACGTVADGVAAARKSAGKDGVVCSVGSLYMAGDVRACFGLT